MKESNFRKLESYQRGKAYQWDIYTKVDMTDVRPCVEWSQDGARRIERSKTCAQRGERAQKCAGDI